MTPDQILEAHANRTGRKAGELRLLINKMTEQEAQLVQSGNSLFLFAPVAERAVECLWFTADHKTFTQDLDKFLAMLKKAKVSTVSSEYTEDEANECFAKSKFKPKISQIDGRFRADIRL